MTQQKRIIVTGATGLIGRALCRRLIARGDQVVVFSRNPAAAQQTVPGAAEYIAWEAADGGPWAAAVNGADAVVHLAGANTFARRWNAAYKREIRESRVISTRGLVAAMSRAAARPKVFVCGSAIGYYGSPGDTPLDERAPPGAGFLAEVVQAWERAAAAAERLDIRTIMLRTAVVIGGDTPGLPLPITLRGASLDRPGVVLDFERGVLPLMAMPFRFFLGGPIGNGQQWFSWIHLEDEVGLLLLALDDARVSGPLNASSPEPVRNREFSAVLGRVLGRPSWLPLPYPALRLLVGEVAETLVASQRVIPAKALALGYQFRYPTVEAALRAALGQRGASLDERGS